MSRLERLLIDYIKNAANTYGLFTNNAPLLLGVSGGKDSLALLKLLVQTGYRVKAVHVTLSNYRQEPEFYQWCAGLAPFEVIKADLLSDLPKSNPCFACTRLRRKLLLEHAQQHNLTTLVFAHHMQDVAVTGLLNMVFSREISTMTPKQQLFNGAYQLARPLYATPEHLLKSYAKEQQLPVFAKSCPYDGHTKRQYITNLLNNMQQQHPGINAVGNIFAALHRVNTGFLPNVPPPPKPKKRGG